MTDITNGTGRKKKLQSRELPIFEAELRQRYKTVQNGTKLTENQETIFISAVTEFKQKVLTFKTIRKHFGIIFKKFVYNTR